MLSDGSAVSLGLVVVLGGAVAAAWFRITGLIDQERIWREAAVAEVREYAEKVASNSTLAHNILVQSMNDHKLEDARTFVSKDSLSETEGRLSASLEKVATRLETIVTRLDRVVVDIARAGMGPPAS